MRRPLLKDAQSSYDIAPSTDTKVDELDTNRPVDKVIDLTDARSPAPDLDLPAITPYHWDDVMPTVSVVIPTWNEAANLPHVLPRIPSWVAEVILVDGGSSDGTVEVARRLLPGVRLVNQSGRGKGNAMAAGFAASRGDIIVSIDADGSMDPAEIHAFVGQLVCGADFVKGSRFAQGGGTVDMEFHRRLGNWGLVKLTKLLYGQRFSDLCYGYIAFWRDALEVLSPDTDGFEIEALINARALKAKLKIAEVPSFESRRIHGVSNLNTFRDGWRVLRTLLRERVSRRGNAVRA